MTIRSLPGSCGTILDAGPGSRSTVCCAGLPGRYVSVIIPGREDSLVLCEVEVTAQSCLPPPGGKNRENPPWHLPHDPQRALTTLGPSKVIQFLGMSHVSPSGWHISGPGHGGAGRDGGRTVPGAYGVVPSYRSPLASPCHGVPQPKTWLCGALRHSPPLPTTLAAPSTP